MWGGLVRETGDNREAALTCASGSRKNMEKSSKIRWLPFKRMKPLSLLLYSNSFYFVDFLLPLDFFR